MSERVLQVLKDKFGDAIVETHSAWGDDTAVVNASQWKEVCAFLRHDPQMGFDMLVDLCGVDYPDRDPRIEIVAHLYSVARRHRVRVKARVGNAEMASAEIDSITEIWPGADWFERETYDLMGVTFKGHPDLRRILLYPEFEGHPLLKDYPANKTQPLIPYRTEEEAGVPLDKLAPFRADEGMSFGRRVWSRGES
ncbi:MAG: NADH-quinone oxidoreductase subunit C [Polyangiaceae bacterium]|nr:NADH-quinone oxidoreductase subunit C [Polyangiaceae bacterium]